MESEYMERLYRIYPWPDNPFTDEGRARYESTLKTMEKIVEHEWFKQLSSREKIGVIEYCSGYGIGGVALSRVLREKYGLETDLLLIDLRKEALKKAVEFSLKELGLKPEIRVLDVTEKIDLGGRYDIALLWGFSTPHFSPWDYVKLLSNIHRSLEVNGLYIYDETDRLDTLIRMGYKWVLPEISGDNIVLTMHKEVDHLKGYIYRVAYNFKNNEYVEMKVYLWSLADSITYTWIFFEDIDFIPVKSMRSGVVVARNPRKTIDPDKYLEGKPTLFKE